MIGRGAGAPNEDFREGFASGAALKIVYKIDALIVSHECEEGTSVRGTWPPAFVPF